MNYTMTDFKADFERAKCELNGIGVYDIQENIPLVFNNRIKSSAYGRCTVSYRNNRVEKIELATNLLHLLSREEIYDVVLHETVHAVRSCWGEHHGGEWLSIANRLNRAYGYNIKRTRNQEGFRDYKKSLSNYTLVCDKCGHEWYYQKMCKTVERCEHYTHTNCGGHLKRKY